MANAITNKMIIELYKAENNVNTTLHTYAKWKELGFQVRKGEKSQHYITIWKHVTKSKKATETDEEKPIQKSKMFMQRSAFFTVEQVEPIAVNV